MIEWHACQEGKELQVLKIKLYIIKSECFQSPKHFKRSEIPFPKNVSTFFLPLNNLLLGNSRRKSDGIRVQRIFFLISGALIIISNIFPSSQRIEAAFAV